MATEEQRLHAVAENLRLIERHITLHWIERQQKPSPEEIKKFRQELYKAVQEIEDIEKIKRVFK